MTLFPPMSAGAGVAGIPSTGARGGAWLRTKRWRRQQSYRSWGRRVERKIPPSSPEGFSLFVSAAGDLQSLQGDKGHVIWHGRLLKGFQQAADKRGAGQGHLAQAGELRRQVRGANELS